MNSTRFLTFLFALSLKCILNLLFTCSPCYLLRWLWSTYIFLYNLYCISLPLKWVLTCICRVGFRPDAAMYVELIVFILIMSLLNLASSNNWKRRTYIFYQQIFNGYYLNIQILNLSCNIGSVKIEISTVTNY